jgi:hypothetical protein
MENMLAGGTGDYNKSLMKERKQSESRLEGV